VTETADDKAAFLAKLKRFEGAVVGTYTARDPVNEPMIRHWCDAVEDGNPVYTDPEHAARSHFGGLVAPPTMLQAWTMPGLPAQRVAPGAARSAQRELFALLDAAGFTSVVATNCRQDYARYLRPGDRLQVTTEIESVSDEKETALGPGHFVHQKMTYRDEQGAAVATMRFRLLKFRPRQRSAAPGGAQRAEARRPRPGLTHDNAFFWRGVAEGRLLVQRCGACGKLRHPPGPMCPACRSLDWDAREASGRGHVYSFVVAHHPPIPPFEYPHVVALVELEEGVRLVAELVGVEPGDVSIGLPVRVEFAEVEEGLVLPRFRPVPGPA